MIWLDDVAAGALRNRVRRIWGDGTPIGAAADEHWGAYWGEKPQHRWVRLGLDPECGGVSDVSGCVADCEELPVPSDLCALIEDWQDRYAGSFGPPDWDDVALDQVVRDAFAAEGRALAGALKRALPKDWTVVFHDISSNRAWLHLCEYAVDEQGERIDWSPHSD